MAGSELAARIVELRETRGLSQAAFARLVGVPASTLSQWELAQARMPADIIPRIAEVLGVDIPTLFGVEASAAPPAERDSTIADRVRDRLLRAWEELPPEELAALDTIAAGLERWRAALLRQEHAPVRLTE